MYLKKNKVAGEKKGLPDDLMMEIAQRLPVESVGRLSCVSKEWSIFLSRPQFVKSHLNRATHHDTIILVNLAKDSSFGILTLTDGDDDGGSLRRSYFPVTNSKVKNSHYKFKGCCNGLVLVKGFYDLVVINPVTKRSVIIPLEVDDTPDIYEGGMFGLGYNSGDDDYKLVKFKDSEEWEIFSFKTMSYKKLTDCPYLPRPYNNFGVYLDGHLYWIAEMDRSSTTYVIFALNLSTEKFEQIPLPTGLRGPYQSKVELAQMGGCLAVVETYRLILNKGRYVEKGSNDITVWIMEKLEFWTKFTIKLPNSSYDDDRYDAICRLGEVEFVLQKNEELVAYNCETAVCRNLGISIQKYANILSFRASLVCPHTS